MSESVTPDGELFTPGYAMRKRATARVCIYFDPTLDRTKQSFKDECDINVLMSRYLKGQPLDHLLRPDGKFGDWSDVPDFQTAQHYIIQAGQLFEAVPAKIRERFMNDPARFIEFATDPNNKDEMRKLGLLRPEPPVQAPVEPPVVPATPVAEPPSKAS